MKRPNGYDKGSISNKNHLPRTEEEALKLANTFKPSNRPKEPGRGEFRKQIFSLEQKKKIAKFFGRVIKVYIFSLRKKVSIQKQHVVQFDSHKMAYFTMSKINIFY